MLDSSVIKSLASWLFSAAYIASIWSTPGGDYPNDAYQYPEIDLGQKVVYRAAVLEVAPYINPRKSPHENMKENAQTINEYSHKAKEQGADIIVFPEYVMFPMSMRNRRSTILLYAEYVPDPKLNALPCEWDKPFNHDMIVRNFSCLARSLAMYLVVNMAEREICDPETDGNCPEDHFYIYDMNVIFDRQGVVISKWRKLHLLNEQDYFNVGNIPDEDAMFTTDFGVKFTQHIGFDSLFYHPSISNIENHGVKDVVMTTSWLDFLPFISAPQAQYSWSRGLNVNLLVANRHRPEQSSLGSGIYTGAEDITKSINTFDGTTGTKLLIRDVSTRAFSRDTRDFHPRPSSLPKLKHSMDTQISLSEVSSNHYFYRENMTTFTFKPIEAGSSSLSGYYYGYLWKRLNYSIEWTLEGEGDYYLLLGSNPTGFPGHQVYRQVCGLLYCPFGEESCGQYPLRKSTSTFINMNITVQFETPYLFPSIIDQDFTLISETHWGYDTKSEGDIHTASIYLKKPINSIYSVAVFGRMFDKDRFCDHNFC